MPVFSRFDPTKSGGVNAQAHPNVYVYTWIPSQQRVRSNPNPAEDVGSIAAALPVTDPMNSGTRTQRVQPNEKRMWFNPRGWSPKALKQGIKQADACAGGCAGGCKQ